VDKELCYIHLMKSDDSQKEFDRNCIHPTLDEEYIREGLAHAAQQVERGEVADWDVEEIKAAARERLAQRQRER